VVGPHGPAPAAWHIVDFEEIGRIPTPGDNVAIASRCLEAGTKFRLRGPVIALKSSLLEGQRFATEVIAAGAALLSWGLPFGWALHEIMPGEYLCNCVLRCIGESAGRLGGERADSPWRLRVPGGNR
jgi:hypothetical protein